MKKPKKTFNKILIANRGECALRITRACRRMGIPTVAIYSHADRQSLHVLFSEEAYNIGPAPSKESYLNIDKILEIATQSGADAIHPGYGFLSESAEFARRCDQAGITFIGPTPENISIMGDKISAKRIMKKAGVPVIPGSEAPVQSFDELKTIASEIGYPLLIKAVSGGGGKGMRLVKSERELQNAYKFTRSEGLNYFGDDSVYVEKYITNPKHIEIQIFGDQFGNVVHLFDRECSVQRRHQKLIEECPSPALTNDLRNKMGQTAIYAAKAISYIGAGTFEFIYDSSTKDYYFLEMNTRLQVEHGVTEVATNIDIVEEQIFVAAGNRLSYAQEDIGCLGHAIEARICAEDPITYVPSPGVIQSCWQPQGPFVRVDSAVYSGYEISIYYDSMVAKVIAWGHTRDEAIARLQRALTEFILTGVKSNIVLHKSILDHPKFLDGTYTTKFVEEELEVAEPELFKYVDDHMFLIAAGIKAYNEQKEKETRNLKVSNRWKSYGRKLMLRL